MLFIEAGQFSEYPAMIGYSVLTAGFLLPIVCLGGRLVKQEQPALPRTADRTVRIVTGLVVLGYVIVSLILNFGMYL